MPLARPCRGRRRGTGALHVLEAQVTLRDAGDVERLVRGVLVAVPQLHLRAVGADRAEVRVPAAAEGGGLDQVGVGLGDLRARDPGGGPVSGTDLRRPQLDPAGERRASVPCRRRAPRRPAERRPGRTGRPPRRPSPSAASSSSCFPLFRRFTRGDERAPADSGPAWTRRVVVPANPPRRDRQTPESDLSDHHSSRSRRRRGHFREGPKRTSGV